MKKIKLNITGMSCNHCLNRVQTTITELEGVEKAKVNLKKATASVKFDEMKQSPEAIANAVKEVGYQAEVAK